MPSAPPLPEEIEAVVLLAGAVSLGRLRAGEVGDVDELVRAGDDGQLDAEGVELPGVFLGGLALA